MASPIPLLAAGVAARLNAATFSRTFSAQRTYLPIADSRQIKDLQVSVNSHDGAIERQNRANWDEQYPVDVSLQQRIAGDAPEAVDPLMDLVDEIIASLRDPEWTPLEGAMLQEAHIVTSPYEQHLREGVFTAVIRLVYRMLR